MLPFDVVELLNFHMISWYGSADVVCEFLGEAAPGWSGLGENILVWLQDMIYAVKSMSWGFDGNEDIGSLALEPLLQNWMPLW